jgi:cytidine deaminase
MKPEELIQAAEEARLRAYAPYSGVAVGAALLAENGQIYLGCNIENAAYSPSVCAERVALFRAVADGERSFSAIAVVGAEVGRAADRSFPPCGVCLQVMAELCDPERFLIYLKGKDGVVSRRLAELLPEGFSRAHLRA